VVETVPVKPGQRLPRDFFARGPLEVAPALLGCTLAHTTPEGTVSIRLTEVEAYAGVGEDPASHAHRGPTRRNAPMFGVGGLLYVYFSYGMHWCANIVTGPPGQAGAVLLRAGSVDSGVDTARSRRPTSRRLADLASGPARLTSALAITADQDGLDLCTRSSRIVVHAGRPVDPGQIAQGPRVGVNEQGAVTPWRFWLVGEPSVSRWRPGGRHRPR
jgi:DNA-3-methyladenine glycosylase